MSAVTISDRFSNPLLPKYLYPYHGYIQDKVLFTHAGTPTYHSTHSYLFLEYFVLQGNVFVVSAYWCLGFLNLVDITVLSTILLLFTLGEPGCYSNYCDFSVCIYLSGKSDECLSPCICRTCLGMTTSGSWTSH